MKGLHDLTRVVVYAVVFMSPAPINVEFSYAAQANDTASVTAERNCGEYPELAPECAAEFAIWLKDTQEWREWKDKYGNFSPINNWGGMNRKPSRPEVPEWLPVFCSPARGLVGVSDTVCAQYFSYIEYDWVPTAVTSPDKQPVYFMSVSSGIYDEQESIIDFLLKSTHFDGIWTNSSLDKRSYGYFGVHLTMARLGRVYIWGPPGLLLMRGPDGQVKVMKSWGVDIYLGSPRVVFTQHQIRLYMSIAKVLPSNGALPKFWSNTGENMVGFSVTLK